MKRAAAPSLSTAAAATAALGDPDTNDLPSSLLFVTAYGYVVALHKATGNTAWRASLDGTGYNPTVVQPHPPSRSLLVASGPNLRALSAATGKQLWENRLNGIGMGYPSLAFAPPRPPPHSSGGSDEEAAGSYSPPPRPGSAAEADGVLTLNGIVFVATNGIVRAIRLVDGADLWEFKTSMFAGASSLPGLLIEDSVLYVAGNGRVWALDPFRGKQLWFADIKHRFYCTMATMRSSQLSRPYRFDPSAPPGAAPTAPPPSIDPPKKTTPSNGVDDSPLYVAANGYISVMNSRDGFRVRVGNNVDIALSGVGYTPAGIIPLPRSNSAIVSAGINLRRVSLADGKLMWENTLSGMGLGVLSVLVGGGVPASSDAANPNELPAYAAEAPPVAGPSTARHAEISDSPVFVAVHGKIFAVRVSNGEVLWRFDPGMFSRIDLPRLLATTDGLVYLAGRDKVDCVDARTGTRKWRGSNGHMGVANLATMLSGNGETNRSSPYDVNLKQTMDDDQNRNSSG
ncbi:quinon protein alcohol dehydrogenase-like superfamily [Zopfochytrium polystomum]|nr:quinon protein alcohol dehydrogenase-like superfamily [Zopfochytrium polystomum]